MLNTGVWRSTSDELTTAVRVSIMPQKVPGEGQSSQAFEIKDARGGQHPYDGNKRVGRFDLLRPSGGPSGGPENQVLREVMVGLYTPLYVDDYGADCPCRS